MSALYQMRYQGVAGNGHGAMYVGKGVVVGIDISGARYNGTYTLSGTTINGTAILTSAGGALVTGQDLPVGGTVPITFSPAAALEDDGWPARPRTWATRWPACSRRAHC